MLHDEPNPEMTSFVFRETLTSLFRFRKIPNTDITTALVITCSDGRYNIVSAEDVKGKGMYIEVLAERVVASNLDLHEGMKILDLGYKKALTSIFLAKEL